jgi:hypothetical protein
LGIWGVVLTASCHLKRPIFASLWQQLVLQQLLFVLPFWQLIHVLLLLCVLLLLLLAQLRIILSAAFLTQLVLAWLHILSLRLPRLVHSQSSVESSSLEVQLPAWRAAAVLDAQTVRLAIADVTRGSKCLLWLELRRLLSGPPPLVTCLSLLLYTKPAVLVPATTAGVGRLTVMPLLKRDLLPWLQFVLTVAGALEPIVTVVASFPFEPSLFLGRLALVIRL